MDRFGVLIAQVCFLAIGLISLFYAFFFYMFFLFPFGLFQLAVGYSDELRSKNLPMLHKKLLRLYWVLVLLFIPVFVFFWEKFTSMESDLGEWILLLGCWVPALFQIIAGLVLRARKLNQTTQML